MKISQIIKNGRKVKKITKTDLALDLEVSLQTIHFWEKGLSKPNEENVAKIAKYFDINILDIDN